MLKPYRVLDLADGYTAFCGRILADLGADVIAVEPPVGASLRRRAPFAQGVEALENGLAWWALARNKRGITLDLESEEGRERFRQLVRSADFVIESFAPGYLDRLDLGYPALSAINPRLVIVSITPFGQTGPKAGWAASDITALGAAGVLYLTGDEDRPPVRLPDDQAAMNAASEAAAMALIAHYARERDGGGRRVDVSAQTATMIATQSSVLSQAWEPGLQVERVGGGLKLGEFHLQFVHPCKDGYVTVTFLFGDLIGPFTRRLFAWMCEEGFVDEHTRDKDWIGYVPLLLSGAEPVSELQRCTEAIGRFTRSKTKAELFEEAKRRGLLIVPISTTADLLRAPQYNARGYWRTATGEEATDRDGQPRSSTKQTPSREGAIYPGPFAKFSATPIRYRRAAPRLGEHDVEVSSEWSVVSSGNQVAPEAAIAANPTTDYSLLTTHSPALQGLKVLDLTWVIAGPLGTRYFSDYGATVIHIESSARIDPIRGYQPFKDGQPGTERSALYHNAMAGKLALSLNLGYPQGREVARRLAAWADLLVENYSPRAMKKWGLGYEDLRKLNPGLVMVSTCLNGQTGPEAMLAGFGTMGAALAGFHELTGWPDRDPAGPYLAYTDYVTPKFIVAAALAALDHKRRTGEGQHVDLSQVEAGMHHLSSAFLDYTVNGVVDSRGGNFSLDWAPQGVYPATGADRWVALACESEAQWRALCLVTGRGWQDDARFATPVARLANHEALDAAIAAWTATHDIDAIEQTLQAVGVPVHRASTSTDVLNDPQLAHRGHLVTVQHPDLGPVILENARTILSPSPGGLNEPGRVFGQDNEYVLRDILGMSDDEIVELTLSGALE